MSIVVFYCKKKATKVFNQHLLRKKSFSDFMLYSVCIFVLVVSTSIEYRF